LSQFYVASFFPYLHIVTATDRLFRGRLKFGDPN